MLKLFAKFSVARLIEGRARPIFKTFNENY